MRRKEYKRNDGVKELMLSLGIDESSICSPRDFVVLGYDVDRAPGDSGFSRRIESYW